MQLLGSEGTLFRTVVIIALLCACGGIFVGVMFIGHKQSFLCPRLEDNWHTVGTIHLLNI